jgi:hypothetical protein
MSVSSPKRTYLHLVGTSEKVRSGSRGRSGPLPVCPGSRYPVSRVGWPPRHDPEPLFLICAAAALTQRLRMVSYRLRHNISAPSSCYLLKLASMRRMAIASAVYQPCLRAFLFPFGTPGDFPPCIRHRPFFIAGDWHKLPRLVLAWQRDARCICKCMGLIP